MYGEQGAQDARGGGIYAGLISQGNVGGLVNAPPDLEAGTLAGVISEQDRLINMFHKELAELEQRIAPFAKPSVTAPAQQVQGGNKHQMSPLAECITRHNARLVGLLDQIRGLSYRIDA